MTFLNKLIKSIGDLIINLIEDCKSTRNQLIWIATGLFVYSVIKGVDGVTLGIVAGLLTIIFTFYFASKRDEHKKPDVIQTVFKGVDPDDI